MKKITVISKATGEVLVEGVRWCQSFWCRLVGFQFRRRLKPGEALILVYPHDSTTRSSIHMFFVFMPLAAIWINRQGKVTETHFARPWRPYYASKEPASYVLEAATDLLERIHPGDELILD